METIYCGIIVHYDVVCDHSVFTASRPNTETLAGVYSVSHGTHWWPTEDEFLIKQADEIRFINIMYQTNIVHRYWYYFSSRRSTKAQL